MIIKEYNYNEHFSTKSKFCTKHLIYFDVFLNGQEV